jgi:hypothetical protein
VVLGVTAALLAALDSLPVLILGEPRGVRRVATLAEAERRLRVRLLVPAYFPDTISWPARTVRLMAGPGAAAALEFDDRNGRPHLLVAQAARAGEVPARLLPAANVLTEVQVALRDGAGTLRRIVGPDGEVWQELSFWHGGRQVVMRLRGSVGQLVRMANSAREAP